MKRKNNKQQLWIVPLLLRYFKAAVIKCLIPFMYFVDKIDPPTREKTAEAIAAMKTNNNEQQLWIVPLLLRHIKAAVIKCLTPFMYFALKFIPHYYHHNVIISPP